MLKNITLILSMLIAVTTISFGQEKFVYNQSGLNPEYLVIEVDSLNKNELFEKVINWIKETYKNPDEVIKTTINNEKVRFEGFQQNMFIYRSAIEFQVDVFYTIEISFKEGRYKFKPVEVKSTFQPNGCYQPGDYFTVDLSDGTAYYKKNGKLKCSNNLPQSLSSYLNNLESDLKLYLTKTSADDDDW